MSLYVTKKDLLEFISNAVTGTKSTESTVSTDDDKSVNVSDIVDNNRAVTDSSGDEHSIRNKAELKNAASSLIDTLDKEDYNKIYDKLADTMTIDKKQPNTQPDKKDNKMTTSKFDENKIRAEIRSIIREVLQEAGDTNDGLPASGVQKAGAAGAALVDPNAEQQKLEDLAVLIKTDVAARTREEITKGHTAYKDATPANPSVSFAKQYVDKAGFKIMFMAEMDKRPFEGGVSELEAFLSEMTDEYIDLLISSGALSAEDISFLTQNPSEISASENFRRFLGGKIQELPESWPETTMPTYTDFISDVYAKTTAGNKQDRSERKRRAANKADT